MTRAVLALGSNLGDRRRHLEAAVGALASALVRASSVYETPPWGDTDQPAYLNQVVIAEADGRGPREWLEVAQQLERAAGRVRDPERPLGPRTLDVDVITVDSVVRDEPDLELPHPRAHLRAFVLLPWAEIDPDAEVPGRGRIADLLTDEQVAREIAQIRRLTS